MTKKHRQRTNTEVLFELMNYSKHGALMQGFVMTALEMYSAQILNQEEEPEGWPDLLSWDGWKGCAEELNLALTKHLGEKHEQV